MGFAGIGIQFQYEAGKGEASTWQIARLLEGLGYDHVTCVHDDEEAVILVSALRHGYFPLEDKDFEVNAIRNVIGQSLTIDYLRLSVAERRSYSLAVKQK